VCAPWRRARQFPSAKTIFPPVGQRNRTRVDVPNKSTRFDLVASCRRRGAAECASTVEMAGRHVAVDAGCMRSSGRADFVLSVSSKSKSVRASAGV